MATELLAVGSGAANSTDLVVVAGTPVTVALKDAAGPSVSGAIVKILLKDNVGQYFEVGELFGNRGSNATVISAAGTYRFSRDALSAACGVFSG